VGNEKCKRPISEILNLTSFVPSFVTEKDNQMLMEDISNEEVKSVIASFEKNKSAGPDGWTVKFYIQ